MPPGVELSIRLIETENELREVFPIMRELRPHLDAETFIARVRAAAAEKFRIAGLWENGSPIAVAGYRVMTSLHTGPTLYLDDFVTTEMRRGQGYGAKLFAFVCEEGRKAGCGTLSLDSGYQRRDAHRFYLDTGMAMVAHHFAMKL